MIFESAAKLQLERADCVLQPPWLGSRRGDVYLPRENYEEDAVGILEAQIGENQYPRQICITRLEQFDKRT